MGRPRIADITEKKCKDCQGLFALADFSKAGRYYRSYCKACYHQRYEAQRVHCKEINKRAVIKYHHKKRHSLTKTCFTCPSVLSLNNQSGYCIHCYMLSWIRYQWRNFEKHTLGDALALAKRNNLKFNTLELIRLLGDKTFPEYRLKHRRSVKFYPGLAFELSNIEWVPVNAALSRIHVRQPY